MDATEVWRSDFFTECMTTTTRLVLLEFWFGGARIDLVGGNLTFVGCAW